MARRGVIGTSRLLHPYSSIGDLSAMKKFLIVTTLSALVSLTALADQITVSGVYGLAPTNFTNQPVTPSVTQFNPALGTLTGVIVKLTGTVSGTAKAESQDSSPTTVTENLQATIALILNGTTQLAQVLPIATVVHNFTAFDGTLDFGGTSGATDSGLTATLNTSINPVDFTPYLGTGNVVFGVSATGSSNANGGGNLISGFTTQGKGQVDVTYIYTPISTTATPEPATLSLIGGSLVGLGALSRRRRGRQ
jgi:hypothetical protein